jgi:hypothetical protein
MRLRSGNMYQANLLSTAWMYCQQMDGLRLFRFMSHINNHVTCFCLTYALQIMEMLTKDFHMCHKKIGDLWHQRRIVCIFLRWLISISIKIIMLQYLKTGDLLNTVIAQWNFDRENIWVTSRWCSNGCSIRRGYFSNSGGIVCPWGSTNFNL